MNDDKSCLIDNGPYNSYYYWENLIKKKEELWQNSFRDTKLDRNSVFAHFVIINCYGECHDKWVFYPSVKALLGFIEYVFLPTAFDVWINPKENDEIIIPLCTIDEIVEYFKRESTFNQDDAIKKIADDVTKIRLLWELDDRECINEIKKCAKEISEHWIKETDRFFYFDVYDNAKELGESLIKIYEEDEMLGIDRIEDDLGLSKEEWLKVCSGVYENEFMKRKFVEILNNRISDMI